MSKLAMVLPCITVALIAAMVTQAYQGHPGSVSTLGFIAVLTALFSPVVAVKRNRK